MRAKTERAVNEKASGKVTAAKRAGLPFRRELFVPGQRVAVAVSGGADSVALLRALERERHALGVVLSVVHIHHGLRGAEADADLAFVAELAERLGLPLGIFRGNSLERAAAKKETLEEAGRELRLGFFREMLSSGAADSIATAHTLDDQAETVLMKLLRGAWTEGLGGIHPVITYAQGRVVRPLLGVPRQAIDAYLTSIDQPWREDASNVDLQFRRNRIRHQLLPVMREYNPQIVTQLARMAAVARDEEAWWQGELERLLPGLLLPGKPVRGGGRATAARGEGAAVALELNRLSGLHKAVRRRVLRAAAQSIGAGELGFEGIETLLALAGLEQDASVAGAGRGESLPGGLAARRTPRELQLSMGDRLEPVTLPTYVLPIPGEVDAPEYGLVVITTWIGEERPNPCTPRITLRSWQPGDRAMLRHSRGPKSVAEVLERMRVYGPQRTGWPVIAQGGTVLWMRGADLDPGMQGERGIQIEVREQG